MGTPRGGDIVDPFFASPIFIVNSNHGACEVLGPSSSSRIVDLNEYCDEGLVLAFRFDDDR